MDEYVKAAVDLVKTQAGVTAMTPQDMANAVKTLAAALREAEGDTAPVETHPLLPHGNPAKSIKENSVVCLECGKSFKVLTKKHLDTHGLTPEEYRAKWGMKKNTPLASKSLARERRNKMKEMKLWERRGKTAPQPEAKEIPKGSKKKPQAQDTVPDGSPTGE